jgi:hypothetical protein
MTRCASTIKPASNQAIEDRHVQLLLEHDMQHLDLHEITTSRRAITQTIARIYSTKAPAPSAFPRLDGNACIALFEGRGTAGPAGDHIALTDPPPGPLTNITAPWGLVLSRHRQPCAIAVRHHDAPYVGAGRGAIYGAKMGPNRRAR